MYVYNKYLDNCCYNRPYDDQTQIRISLETQAKLYIQDLIKNGKISLVTSYILEYENSKNRFLHKRNAIADFINVNESYYVGVERYFITTDDRLFRYYSEEIAIVTPGEFIRRLEAEE